MNAPTSLPRLADPTIGAGVYAADRATRPRITAGRPSRLRDERYGHGVVARVAGSESSRGYADAPAKGLLRRIGAA